MERIWWDRLDSVGKFPDGRARLDVVFKDSKGYKYMWTAQWKDVRQLYGEAARIEKLNSPKSREIKSFEETTIETLGDLREGPQINFKLIAIRLGDELKNKTYLNQINRVGTSIFDFKCLPHPHHAITSVRAQLIHDWIISLSEQIIDNEKILALIKEFAVLLDPQIDLSQFLS